MLNKTPNHYKMTTPSGLITEALLSEATAEPNLQVSILFNQNIDLQKAKELTSAYVNDSWAPKLKELIDGGWTLFRMQTEFGTNGHHTMAYFAKF